MGKRSRKGGEGARIGAVDAEGVTRSLAPEDLRPDSLHRALGFESPRALVEKNPHLLMVLGTITRPAFTPMEAERGEPPAPTPEPSPEEITQALALLLRAIALAARPRLAMVPPPEGADPDEVERLEDGRPVTEIARREGCRCPCPDGVVVEFRIEWDNVGPNIELFKGDLRRGQTANAPGQAGGASVEIEGSTELIMDLGNPALDVLNTADLEIVFEAHPFFARGFDEERCCLVATGNFTGNVRLASFEDRGKANETVTRGRMAVNKTVTEGECDGRACCTATYRWDYRQSFNIDALTYDVDVVVTGVVSVTIQVFDVP